MKKHLITFALFFFTVNLVGVYIWKNDWVRDDKIFFASHEKDISFSSLKELFQKSYFFELASADISYYRPLSRWLYRFENLLFSQELFFYHITNLFLHAFLLFVIFMLLRKWGVSERASAFVGLFIGLHALSHSFFIYKSGVIDIVGALVIVLSLWLYKKERLWLNLILGLMISSGLFVKEFVFFAWIFLLAEVWRQGDKKAMYYFLPMAVISSSCFFSMRADVVVSPPLFQMLVHGELMMAWLRESLWTPLWLLFRPDLCQQGRLAFVSSEGALSLVLLAVIFWLVVAYVIWKKRCVWAASAFVAYWMLWSLALPNAYSSLELSQLLLYLPDHLMFFPLMILLVPIAIKYADHPQGKYILLFALLVNSFVSMNKVREWRSSQSIFETQVALSSLSSKPYKSLARIHLNNDDLQKAEEVLVKALQKKFEDAELYRLTANCLQRKGDVEESRNYWAKSLIFARKRAAMELTVILNSPQGQKRAQQYLEQQLLHYPKDPWFSEQLQRMK